MKLIGFRDGFKIPSKSFIASIFLYSSTFACFFLFFWNYADIFSGLGNSSSSLFIFGEVIFLSLVVIFAIVGSMIGEKFSRRKVLFCFIALGTFGATLLTIFQGLFFSIVSVALIGMSFGLSFPVVNAFVSDSTVIEERARVFGSVIFLTFFLVIILQVLATSIFEILLFCILLRATGFLTLAIDPCSRKVEKLNKKLESRGTWRSIFVNRTFVFYLLPWLMFNVANGLYAFVNIPSSDEYAWAINFGNNLHIIGAGLFAFLSGVLADRRGRKQPIRVGLVLLGVSYGILTFATTSAAFFAYLTISGVAWGSIMVVYFVVPGDLAFPGFQERFYALGAVIPFIFYLSFSSLAKLIDVKLPVTSLAPILTIVLFVSMMPIFFVKETLPESTIRQRKMKEHVDKLEEIIKESKKSDVN